MLFQRAKIQDFRCNSQLRFQRYTYHKGCFKEQRYKILDAIHNLVIQLLIFLAVVSKSKDTRFQMQFTTKNPYSSIPSSLFQRAKIQDFRCNSQLCFDYSDIRYCCFKEQRYKILDAIHNYSGGFMPLYDVVSKSKDTRFQMQFTTIICRRGSGQQLFQRAKIQDFRCNSQLGFELNKEYFGCFKEQRYKILDAIHNHVGELLKVFFVVSKSKDTRFQMQFTTIRHWFYPQFCCFKEQRYKILDAIHNFFSCKPYHSSVVSKSKDTRFQMQFTTYFQLLLSAKNGDNTCNR